MTLLPPCLLLCLALVTASLRAETTDAILARMDKAAPSFTGVSASLKMTTYTKVLDDKADENGTLKMQRVKKDTRAVVDFSGDRSARILSFEGRNLRLFYPKLNEYTDVSLGKNGNVLNQFLLLGFGSSGKELAESYAITDEGTEKVSSVNTTKLLLVPKAAEVKEHIEKVEIWIADGGTSPIQQQFYQPSGNYQKVAYSDVVLNPPGQKVGIQLPKDARKQKK